MRELHHIVTEYGNMQKKIHPSLLGLRGYSYQLEKEKITRIAWIMDRKSGDLVDMIKNTGIF